jgi:hypothetical protein
VRDTIVLEHSETLNIVGWRMVTDDLFMRSVTVTDSSGRELWRALPGWMKESFPTGTGIRLRPRSTLTIEYTRDVRDGLVAADFASRFELVLSQSKVTPLIITSVPCGMRASLDGTVFGLRPVVTAGYLEVRARGNAPKILGRFRTTADPYSLRYWLKEPMVFRRNSPIVVEGSNCHVDVIASSAPNSVEKSFR